MSQQIRGNINQISSELVPGLPLPQSWFQEHGFSRDRVRSYALRGLLKNPVRGVYYRSGPPVKWQHVVLSLQTLLGFRVLVGGYSALELHGYSHFLSPKHPREIHLYGPDPLPTWVNKLSEALELPTFVHHRDDVPAEPVLTPENSALTALLPWGEWGFNLVISSHELAILQWLEELPDRASWENVDKVFEGLTNLRPRVLEKLLPTRSVKVRRLFFFFADRHPFQWLNAINRTAIDLGKGKRMLVRGGKLNRAYQITVPAEMMRSEEPE